MSVTILLLFLEFMLGVTLMWVAAVGGEGNLNTDFHRLFKFVCLCSYLSNVGNPSTVVSG